ncbi:uncharacterized protein [Littorina saxatilis]|uniref:Uncharacterized protein n=1 Tax=Littorina saxatilis TaxID=31220 RepID=A0AAN9G2R7_9CAEN
MGSGPSKDQKGKDTARDGKSEKPVANVNNQSSRSNPLPQQQQPAQTTFITQSEDTLEDRNNSWNDSSRNQNDRGGGEIGRSNDYDRFPAAEEQTTQSRVWRPDQESQRELNEVLQIPTDNNRYSNRPVNTVNPVRQEDLPETYAQRKQRQQYTVNQQMLIRQKTIYRDPKAWEQEGEEEEEMHSGSTGFDPNKFRSVNFGQATNQKRTIFTTSGNQDNSVQYMPGQRDNMDEFDVTSRRQQTSEDLPRYNASEQDLMASLERELL